MRRRSGYIDTAAIVSMRPLMLPMLSASVSKMDIKKDTTHVEMMEAEKTMLSKEVELVDEQGVYLVPTPSADPNGW